MANIFRAKHIISRTGTFSHEVTAPNLVYNTGDQIVSGLKDFATRPTVNTIPVLLSGENADGLSVLVKNDDVITLVKGQPVYIYGANGDNILVRAASNTGEAFSSKTLGLLSQTLAPNTQGYVTTEGALEGVDTSLAGSVGDPIWLGPTGNLIFGLAQKPYAPNHLVYLGVVERKQANNGKIYVKIQNGFEIDELHNVNINHTYSLSNEDILRYNSASGLWFNQPLNTGIFQSQISSLSGAAVLTYGDQNINGIKTFTSRPTVNSSGIVVNGDIIDGDLTGTLPSPTINKIQGYQVDLGSPPAPGQTLQWNGSSWVAGTIPIGGNGGGGRVYYFNFANTSGIAPTGGLPTTGDFPLSLLGINYSIGSGQAQSADLSPQDTYKLICGFVTSSGDAGITEIPAGLWDINIWASVNSTSATQSSIKAVVNIYNPANSTYRKIAESDDLYLYETNTIAQYILNTTVPQTGISSNERIYVEIYGRKYTIVDRKITLYFDSYRPSHIHTTIPSVLGNGVVKVINGVYQSPATGIFDVDVDHNANIAQSKIANLTSDLNTLRVSGQTLDNKINSLSGTYQNFVDNLDATYATDIQLNNTGLSLINRIDSLSGSLNSSGIALNSTIDSLSGLSVLLTGNQNISGTKNFYTRPTVNNTGVLLIGEVLGEASLPANVVYTTGTQTIVGLKNFSVRPTVNNTGVLLIGETLPSNIASGAGGAVFITDIDPNGAGNVGDKVYENPADVNNTALMSCSTTTQNVLVDIYALQGRTRFRPKIYITGSEITMTRQSDLPVFRATNVAINLNNATSLRVDHEEGSFHTVAITQDVPPQVLSALFYGGYPGSQTELKAGDTFNIAVTSDVPIVSIQIDDFGALQASTTNVSAGTSFNLTSRLIANRGTTTQDLGARVRVQKANGSWSDWFLTTSQGSTNGVHTLKLNNTYPSISIGSITYPSTQQALKDSEQATVSNTVSNFDVISYTSPNGDLTISSSSTYQTSKTVTRAAGNYNISTNNFRIQATRNANNAVTTNTSAVVNIAHTAPTLTVSVPAARLRTGGNDGTSTPSYTVTITASQQLLSAPTLTAPAGGGTFLGGGFSGSGTTWTRSIQISDSLTKTTYTWGAISATNLAGKVVTTITTGSTYVIGGFLSRTVTLAPFANEVNINTSVSDFNKMTFSWPVFGQTTPNRRAVGTTATPDPFSWTIDQLNVNPTIVRILDTNAAASSSQPSSVTVEETV